MILCAEGLVDIPVDSFPCPHLIPDPLVAYACGRVHGCKNTREAENKLKKILGENDFVYANPRHVSVHPQDPITQKTGSRLVMLVDTNQDDSYISVNGESLSLGQLMLTVDPSALV
jgi:hypothetical protein